MENLVLIQYPVLFLIVFCGFAISASVGLGGSLLIVPMLVLVVGPHQGVVLSALLLGINNIFKCIAYRRSIPWRQAALIVLLLSMGALIGASVLLKAPASLVTSAVLLTFVMTFVVEKNRWATTGKILSPFLAFISGASSGFSGTSGPLKGIAIRNLNLDRIHFAGAASVASLAGDMTKVGVFASGDMLDNSIYLVVLGCVPLMLLGTYIGFRTNKRVGEYAFSLLFWGVMIGYGFRLIFHTF